ncbi:hypothetical protein JYU34_021740 [Plutella xylostella]|uniref:PIN domain-containing protein n=1 Tax=Plutella xylostella TaxID=51655 RepID=A0ABQ7PRC1_PLUXY|nr:hypothetical protein JYU34_021740 [Plutella xylostella]
MDPKTLDSIGVNQSNRNGWILCPSKTFPGKYYYFNVLSGEAAWCLSDNEKLKCPSKADNCHSYPEPSGVSNDMPTNPYNTSNFTTKPIYKPSQNFGTQFDTSTPMFDRPMFPQYLSPYIPYMPQPWMAPMMQDNQRNYAPNISKTVQNSVHKFHETPIMVQQTSVPLSLRFNQRLNIKRVISFDVKSKTTKMVQTDNPTVTEKAIDGKCIIKKFKNPLTKSKCVVTSTDMHTEESHFVPSRKRTLLDNSEIVRRDYVQKNITSNTKLETVCLNTNFNSQDSVENCTKDDKNEEIVELAENDLRLILLAKRRRKSVDTGSLARETEMNHLKEKLAKTTVENNEKPERLPAKKRVSFSFDYDKTDLESVSSMPSEVYGFAPTTYPQQPCHPDPFVKPYNIQRLRSLGRDSCNKHLWYIVADTQILMGHFAFVDMLVRMDPQCRLMVSHATHTELLSLGGGDSRGRPLAETARRCLRLLADCTAVEREEIRCNIIDENGIVNCCKKLARDRYHVVLITDDEDLKHEAKISGIQTFNLQELKDFISNDTSVQLDLSSIKITVDNVTVKEKSSIFEAQTKLPFKNQANIEESRRQHQVDKGINCNESMTSFEMDINGEISKVVDAQTSPIFFGEKSTKNVTITTGNVANYTGNHDNSTTNMEIGNHGETFGCNMPFESPSLLPKDNVNNELWGLINYQKNPSKIYQEVEKELKVYCEKNTAMKDNFENRKDELICCYVQTMEDVLTNVLQNESTTPNCLQLQPPWYLHEVLECVKRMFQNDTRMTYVVEQLSGCVQKCGDKNGQLKTDIEFNDFITIVGYGVLLIRYLKFTLQDRDTSNSDLSEAEHALNDVLIAPADFPTVHRDPEPEGDTEKLIKKPTDVLEYLKKHYPAWRALSESSPTLSARDTVELAPNNEVKIVRTFGRDLKKLKFDNDKNMTVEKSPKIPTKEPKTTNTVNKENKTIDKTKIIRNVDAIKEFEDKLKSSIDLDALDYDESNNNITDIQTDTISNNMTKYLELSDNSTNMSQYCNIHEPDVIIEEHSDKNGNLVFNEDMSARDGYTIDSGIENSLDGSQAFSLVKLFFTELKGFFMSIYDFIQRCNTAASPPRAASNCSRRRSERSAVWRSLLAF